MTERASDVKFVSPRQAHLLAKAAEALNNLTSPFETWWLSENEVAINECATLSETIAAVIKWFIAQPNAVQAEVLLYDTDPSLAKYIGLAVLKNGLAKKVDEFFKPST